MSEFFGGPRLGYKTDSLQQDGLLGDEYDVVSAEYISDLDMYTNENAGRVRVKWVRNTSGGALKPGSLVKLDATHDMAHDVTQAGEDDIVAGVVDPFLSEDVADDEKFLIITRGEVDVLSGAAIVKGVSLASDADGKAVTNDLSTIAKLSARFGFASEAASGADELKKAVVDFRN